MSYGRPDPREMTFVGSAMSPFSQRVAIVLAERGTPVSRVQVDLGNRPAWFDAIAPVGRLPLLRIRRPGQAEQILFESLAIVDYLEEISPDQPLYPADPILRAAHRAWSNLASELIAILKRAITAEAGSALDIQIHHLRARLSRLDRYFRGSGWKGPFFGGQDFGNVDAAYAPFFRQIAALDRVAPTHLVDGLSAVETWATAVIERSSVLQTIPDDHDTRFIARLRLTGSALLSPTVIPPM